MLGLNFIHVSERGPWLHCVNLSLFYWVQLPEVLIDEENWHSAICSLMMIVDTFDRLIYTQPWMIWTSLRNIRYLLIFVSTCTTTCVLFEEVTKAANGLAIKCNLLTLLPCWIFRHHCAKAMLVAQPSLLKGLCPLGTSTSESGWAQAKWAMSRRLLVSALLWDVYPGIWGSSGTVHRNLSSVRLNWSTEQPVVFLTSAGRALNSLWPRMARLASLSFCSRHGAFLDTLGMMHSLPLLGCDWAVTLFLSPSASCQNFAHIFERWPDALTLLPVMNIYFLALWFIYYQLLLWYWQF